MTGGCHRPSRLHVVYSDLFDTSFRLYNYAARGSANANATKGSKMLKFLCAVLLSLFSTMSAWAASVPIKVLIFSKTADYRHASIPAGISALEELGALHGWDVDATEDASQFNDNNLKRYDVVVWLSTSGNILDSQQKASYERFQQSHKGTVAIHEAGTDTERV